MRSIVLCVDVPACVGESKSVRVGARGQRHGVTMDVNLCSHELFVCVSCLCACVRERERVQEGGCGGAKRKRRRLDAQQCNYELCACMRERKSKRVYL